MRTIASMIVASLATVAAAETDPAWPAFTLEDGTKLLYEATRQGPLIERIYRFTDPAKKSVIWEYNARLPAGSFGDPWRQWIISARQFGDVFCAITAWEGYASVTYYRIDTSRTPPWWISTSVGWRSPDEDRNPVPTFVMENPFEFSFQRPGKEKTTYRVHDSGLIEVNGVRMGHALVNGKFVDSAKVEDIEPIGKPVWPPKARETPTPPPIDRKAAKPAGTAPEPTGPSASNSPHRQWRWWAGAGAILGILSGWLLLRKRTRAGK